MTDAIMFGCRPSFGATITPAGRPDEGGEAPAHRQHRADADADELGRARVVGGAAQAEAELGAG